MTRRILWALSPKLAEPASSLETKKVQEAAEELLRQRLGMWGDFPLPLDPGFLLLLLGDELTLVIKSKRISGHGWGVFLRS